MVQPDTGRDASQVPSLPPPVTDSALASAPSGTHAQCCPRGRCARGSGVSPRARADNSSSERSSVIWFQTARSRLWRCGRGSWGWPGLSSHGAHSSLHPAHPGDAKCDPGPLWCQMRQWKYSLNNLIPASASSFFSQAQSGRSRLVPLGAEDSAIGAVMGTLFHSF